MSFPKLYVEKMHSNSSLPKRANDHAAGYDLFATDDVVVHSMSHTEVHLGIKTQIPEGFFAKIFDRSGFGFKGLSVLAGVIDSDYRGEWKLKFFNSSREAITIPFGKACAQFVLLEHGKFPVVEVEELTQTNRGEKGFGSTDVNANA